MAEVADDEVELPMINAANAGRGDEGNIDQDNETIRRMLEERVEKKEEQILKMETSVFQVANYYFVFQGVILTAIIKGSSSSLKCHYFLLPFFLSLMGAILNFGTLFIIVDKYKKCLDELDDRTLILYQHLYPTRSATMHKNHKREQVRRRKIVVASKVLFCLFAALNLLATWIIPCLT